MIERFAVRYAHPNEYRPLYRCWNFPRTALVVANLMPFAEWNQAMWRNLARRIEIEGGRLFGRPGTYLRIDRDRPLPAGACKHLSFLAGVAGEHFTVAAYSEHSDECNHLVFRRPDGWEIRVDWTIPLGQEPAAAYALTVLCGDDGETNRLLVHDEGLWYWDTGNKQLCFVKHLRRPGGGWAWKAIWAPPTLSEGLYLILTDEGEVLDEAFVPKPDQPPSEEFGRDALW